MTNDDIKRAAYKYAGDVNRNRKSGIEPYSVVDFMEGAKWRVNGVWHDANEEPKYDEYFLYENAVHAYHVDGIYPSEDEPFVWNDYVKDWGLIRWAYMKDLIPNTEK
jgi:hypothetical protein